MVRAGLDGATPAPSAARLDLLRRHIASLDGPFAAERLVDAFDELDAPEQPLAGSGWRRAGRQLRLAPLRSRRAAHAIAARVGSREPSTREGRVGAAGKFRGSSLAEAEELIGRFRAATGRFGEVRCSEIGPDLYAVTPGTATGR
jgi:hypothetical protein